MLFQISLVKFDLWPVSEWSDDESARVAEVLVAIHKVSVGLSHDAVVYVCVPVETKLR